MKRSLIFSRIDKNLASSPTEIENESLVKAAQFNVDAFINSEVENQLLIYHASNPFEVNEAISLPLPKQIHSLALTQQEINQIQEIQMATHASAMHDEAQLNLIGETADLIYALNLAELYVKKSINFCKHISAFKCISNQNDKISLLKQFITELMLIRFAFSFNIEKDGFPVFEVKKTNLLNGITQKLRYFYNRMKLAHRQF